VKAFSLYEKTSTFGGFYAMLLMSRLQVLYYILILPTYLVYPYMIWASVAIGMLSQLNLMILSKWFASDYAAKGYQGFVELFGERAVRFFAFAGLFFIFLNVTVNTLGYVEMIHKFIYPSMDEKWQIVFLLLISCYVAALGMEKTIRFVVISFLSSFWILAVFIPFFLPPMASLHDLYPLIPTSWSSTPSWKSLLIIWAAFSGPEYLVCMSPWLGPRPKMLKYLSFANALSIFEYSYFFVASLLFFGSDYLSKTRFPVIHMSRYLQSPVFERIDIILISVHLFHLVFAISIFLLCFHGAIRIAVGKAQKPTTRIGYLSSCMAIFACTIMINQWFWKTVENQNFWFNLLVWAGAFTYFLVPGFLLAAVKRKGRI
jgi:hypothetical protein